MSGKPLASVPSLPSVAAALAVPSRVGPQLALNVALMTALLALADPPWAILLALGPVALVAAGCALLAVVRPGATWLRAGLWTLALFGLQALVTLAFASSDWVHLLWTVEYSLCGLLLGAGLLLVRVWPEDRRREPSLFCGWNGAAVVLGAMVVLGALPLVLSEVAPGSRPLGRASGSPLAALLEVGRYGFDGTVPALMEPESLRQRGRGLGHPPRWVTVPMGASLLAAACWIVFAALALAARALPAGRLQSSFSLGAPLVLAPPIGLLATTRFEHALWDNDPRLVAAFGPTLALAGVAALVLLFTVRRADRRASRG